MTRRWIPAWLDRLLPAIHVESEVDRGPSPQRTPTLAQEDELTYR